MRLERVCLEAPMSEVYTRENFTHFTVSFHMHNKKSRNVQELLPSRPVKTGLQGYTYPENAE